MCWKIITDYKLVNIEKLEENIFKINVLENDKAKSYKIKREFFKLGKEDKERFSAYVPIKKSDGQKISEIWMMLRDEIFIQIKEL